MTLSFRSLLIGAALLAFAPGCGSTVEKRGTDGSDGPTVGDTDEGDDADDDVPFDQPNQGARSSMCPSSAFSGDADEAVAVSWSNDAANLVMRDGSLVELPLPTEAPPSGTTAGVGVVVGPDVIVVSRGWSTFGDVPTAHSTVRWFDRRGEMIDELVSEEGLWASFVGTDGVTVFYRQSQSFGYFARLADGSELPLEGMDVWGEPLAGGWLRGFDNVASRAVFVNPATQERRDLDTSTYPTFVDDGFAYLAAGEAAPILVHATPDATVRTDLAALEGISIDGLYLQAVPHSSWALVTDYPTGRAWRVDLAAGTAEPIVAPPPAGSELLEDNCGLSQPMVSTSGQIFAGLQTAGDGQAAIASIDGGWQKIGEPYAQPGIFGVVETAGTFVVTAGDGMNTYCPILDWDQPASEDAITIDIAQLVRPADGVVRLLDEVDPWSIVPSRDGGCVTFTRGAWEGTEIERSIVDVRGDEVLALGGDQFVWLP